MHDIKWIRENPESFDQLMMKRNFSPISSTIIELDEERRQIITLIQKLQQARNEKAKLVSQIANKESFEFKQAIEDANHIKERLADLEKKFSEEDKLNELLATLPNLLDDDVPTGKSEEENIEVAKWGELPKFDFIPKQHFELGEELTMMDFTQAAKMSGSRFCILKSDLARMERALASFMLDMHTKEYGYTEVLPPYLVRDHALYGTGQLPKFAEESFVTTNGYRLIPTSEVSLVNLVADSILDEAELPLRFCAYTPCFRSEAGSAGRDTRGMIRLHQFNKVELVVISTPENSHDEHMRIIEGAEEILKRLKLPFRRVLLCSGDTSFAARKTYDLEVWLPGQDKYREISSCSNCGDFQARRMKSRYRNKANKEVKFIHSLNGSGLAVGRTLVAILENYQNKDGSITIPEVLRPYMNGQEIIKKP